MEKKGRTWAVVLGVAVLVGLGRFAAKRMGASDPPPASSAPASASASAPASGPTSAPSIPKVAHDVPASFAQAEAKLVPVVRERISYEVARIMASPAPHRELPAEPPHVALTGDLWGVLAYETGDQLVPVDAETFRQWKVSFDDVWLGAMKRLEERSRAGSTSDVDGVRELRYGDGNDSARVLLPALLDKHRFARGTVLAMPREGLLLAVSASDEASLGALATRLFAEWDRGGQNARALRLRDDGTVVPLELDASQPQHARLTSLRRSTEQREERLQREALRKRLGEADDVPVVLSPLSVRDKDTFEELTFVVQVENVTTLLPRADYVVWDRVDMAKRTATTLACAPWAKAEALMKGRWKETPLHPARWLASSQPTAKELKALGCDRSIFRGERGTAP